MAKPASPTLQSGNALATGLKRCFVIGEGSGQTLADSSGNAANLTTRTSGSAANAAWGADGTVGAYISFDGSTRDAVGSDTGLPIGTADRAFAVLFRAANTAVSGEFATYGTTGDANIAIGLAPPFGVTETDWLSVTTLNHNAVSTQETGNNTWRVGVASCSGGTWSFYVDGTAAGTGTVTGMNTVLGGSTSFLLGQLGGGVAWITADLAGVQVWSRALDSGDVAALQTDFWAAVRPPAASLSPSSATIAVGATQLFTPTGLSGSILWSSSSPSVATIPAGPAGTQTATAVGVGSTTIGATDGTLGASATLTVVPAAPTITSVTGGNTQNTIAFTATGTGGTAFDLYRGTSSGGEAGSPIATGITSPHVDTGLTNGITYFYKLKASNGGGSAFSNEMSGTPSAAPALSPATVILGVGSTQTFSASGFTGGTVTLASGTPSVMSVSGMVGTAAAAGSATITATGVTNPAQTATAAVTVVAVRNYLNVVKFTASPTLNYKHPDGTSYSWSGLAVGDLGDGLYSLYGTLPTIDLAIIATDGITTEAAPWSPTAEGLFTAAGAATLSQSFPSNFSTLVIDGSGRVTAATVVDKAGYSLAAAGLDAITVETGINARQALSPILAAAGGKSSGFDPDNLSTPIIYYAAGASGTATERLRVVVDADGNRTSTTLSIPS